MLARSSISRCIARTSLWLATLAAVPLVVAFAAEQEKKAAGNTAILRGRVQNEFGAPLEGVVVRVAVPAADMRFVGPGVGPAQFETISDANGEYRLDVAGIDKPTNVSLEAIKAGYSRLSGTLMRGGNAPRPVLPPGGTVEANLKLDLALYFKGIVVDENDQPIPGVQIAANANSNRGSGGVERTQSDQSGQFELFNYSLTPFTMNFESTKGVVSFVHPDYIGARIEDVYAIAADERSQMRMVMGTGYKLSGVVRDASGKAVPKVMVRATSRTGGYNRKAVLTDSDGKFMLPGLSAGSTVLNTRSLGLLQKVEFPIAVDRDRDDLDLRLQPMVIPANLATTNVLGMKLTDATAELRAAYDISGNGGALILDPGPSSDRLQIGKLEHGYTFWMVGNQRVTSVREFVERILAEAEVQDPNRYSIRVVYSLSTLAFDGTNTQYLKLKKEDIEQVKIALEGLTATAK
jgi:hypothetical protein